MNLHALPFFVASIVCLHRRRIVLNAMTSINRSSPKRMFVPFVDPEKVQLLTGLDVRCLPSVYHRVSDNLAYI